MANLDNIMDYLAEIISSGYKIVVKTINVGNVSANTGAYNNQNVNDETGYKPVGILGYAISHYACSIGSLRIDAEDLKLYWSVRNNTSSAVSGVTINANVLYKKQ